MCRGAKEARELYRLADEEMEHIRNEETQAAAEEIAGAHGDLDILAAAAAIIARQNEYRVQSLVEQDLAEPELKDDETKPATHFLTAEGKKRFGHRLRSVYKQKDIADMKEAAEQYTFKRSELPGQIKYMAEMCTRMERTLAVGQLDPASAPAPPPDPALPCDPLTGQPLNELPAGVKSSPLSDSDETTPSAEVLEGQIRQIEEQIREYEKNYEIENYDMKRERFHAGLDPEDESLIIVKTRKVAYPELNWSTLIQYWGKKEDKSQEWYLKYQISFSQPRSAGTPLPIAHPPSRRRPPQQPLKPPIDRHARRSTLSELSCRPSQQPPPSPTNRHAPANNLHPKSLPNSRDLSYNAGTTAPASAAWVTQ